MGGIRDALRRLGKYLSDKEPVRPPTRLSEDEALSLAHIAADREGHVLDPPISIWPGYDDAGRVVWTILSNAIGFGGHVRVTIDDATGEMIAVGVAPR